MLKIAIAMAAAAALCASVSGAIAAPGDIAWAWTGPTGNNQYMCIQRKKGGGVTPTRKFGSKAEVNANARRAKASVRWMSYGARSSIPCAQF